jgi:hypothetical protein
MNYEFTKRQQRLLRKVHKTNKWTYRTPFLYLCYIYPLIFIAGELWLFAKLDRMFDYCIAIRIDGVVHPMDISLNTAMLWIILPVSFLVLIMSWMVVSSWQEKRIFKEILDIKEEKSL